MECISCIASYTIHRLLNGNHLKIKQRIKRFFSFLLFKQRVLLLYLRPLLFKVTIGFVVQRIE